MDEPVDAVLFDIDDTLCAYRRPGEELLAAAFAEEDIEPFFEIGEYYDRFEEFATGRDTTREIRTACFAAIAAERGYDPAVGRALAERYERARDHREVAFLPGAREAIDALADEHSVGVVTNGGPDTQKPKLDGLGLAGVFETVVYAGRDVAPKPDRAPFDRALADLGVPAERALHVGNSFDADVAGAHATGLRSVWVPKAGSYDERGEPAIDARAPDYTLQSLRELTPAPWQ